MTKGINAAYVPMWCENLMMNCWSCSTRNCGSDGAGLCIDMNTDLLPLPGLTNVVYLLQGWDHIAFEPPFGMFGGGGGPRHAGI